MPNTLLDTGPTVALVNRSDKHHRRAVAWFSSYRGTLLTTEAVITEVAYVLAPSIPHQSAALMWLDRAAKAGRLVVEPMRDLPAIAAIMEKYADLPADFADASLVWLGRSRRATRIVTVDATDFNIYRAYSGKPFRNLF